MHTKNTYCRICSHKRENKSLQWLSFCMLPWKVSRLSEKIYSDRRTVQNHAKSIWRRNDYYSGWPISDTKVTFEILKTVASWFLQSQKLSLHATYFDTSYDIQYHILFIRRKYIYDVTTYTFASYSNCIRQDSSDLFVLQTRNEMQRKCNVQPTVCVLSVFDTSRTLVVGSFGNKSQWTSEAEFTDGAWEKRCTRCNPCASAVVWKRK